MLHQSDKQFGPCVNDSLQYVVTSFRVRPEDIMSLDVDYFNQKVQLALAPKLWLTTKRKKSRINNEGITFLGTKKKPANKCFGPRVPNQLALLGFVPQKVRIYLHDFRYDQPALRANIYWNRRDSKNDHPQTDASIDENRKLYKHFQSCAWNVNGVWFEHGVRQGCMVLDFYGKDPYFPPSRRSELSVDAYGIVRIDNT